MHPHMLVGGGVLCKACTVLTSWLLHPPGVNQSPYGCEWLCVWGGGGETGRDSDKDTSVLVAIDKNTETFSRNVLTHLVVLGCLLVQGDGVVLDVGLLQQRVVELKLCKAGAGIQRDIRARAWAGCEVAPVRRDCACAGATDTWGRG